MYNVLSSPYSVFTIPMMAMLDDSGAESRLSARLNYSVKRGYLKNIRKGIYTKKKYEPEELGCLLYTPCYISLNYVLQRAGIIFQFDSAITLVSYISREIVIDGQTFSYRRIKEEIFTNTIGIEMNGITNIATPERAFLDMLYLNSNFYFDNLTPLNKERVYEILPIYQNKTMVKRVKELLS